MFYHNHHNHEICHQYAVYNGYCNDLFTQTLHLKRLTTLWIVLCFLSRASVANVIQQVLHSTELFLACMFSCTVKLLINLNVLQQNLQVNKRSWLVTTWYLVFWLFKQYVMVIIAVKYFGVFLSLFFNVWGGLFLLHSSFENYYKLFISKLLLLNLNK